MLTLKEIERNETKDIISLLHSAFPVEERREDHFFVKLLNEHKSFHCLQVLKENQFIGLLHYWKFETFSYIEHFAIHPKYRNQHLGEKVLKQFIEQQNVPIILEVELENKKDPFTLRRIHFYQRLGFILWNNSYAQPPYRKDDSFLPMQLMSHGDINSNLHFKSVQEILYTHVYGIKTV